MSASGEKKTSITRVRSNSVFNIGASPKKKKKKKHRRSLSQVIASNLKNPFFYGRDKNKSDEMWAENFPGNGVSVSFSRERSSRQSISKIKSKKKKESSKRR